MVLNFTDNKEVFWKKKTIKIFGINNCGLYKAAIKKINLNLISNWKMEH